MHMQTQEDTSDVLIQKVQEKLFSEAVKEIESYLSRTPQEPDQASLKILMNEVFTIQEPFIATTDISSWFIESPEDHINIMN